ncbi:hypothetical protein FGG78_22320 [Thioclava sp. BHET1]|nr:hypothetical protein FGG78_22320 [Thioclava sp. BHET1]
MRKPIDVIIVEYGAWTLLGATLLALLRGKRLPRDRAIDTLNNHLRRDIGLPHAPPGPPDWTFYR